MDNEQTTIVEIHPSLYTVKNSDGVQMNITPDILDNIACEYYGEVIVYDEKDSVIVKFTGEEHEKHAASYEQALVNFKKK
jgi:hypothetical protein